MGSYYLPYNGLQIWVAFVWTGRGVEEEEEEEGASTGSVSCRSSNLAARRLLDKRVTTHPDRLGNRIQFSTLTKDCCQHRNMAGNTKNFLCEDFFKRAKRCQRSALQADNVALRQSFRLRGALCNSRLIRVYCYPFFSKKKKVLFFFISRYVWYQKLLFYRPRHKAVFVSVFYVHLLLRAKAKESFQGGNSRM